MSLSTDADTHPLLPARYDHVGSFLRPGYLLQARAQNARGEIDA
ncbi:MAG: 5-methyltetrahydropteroyltriglutamate--homocysteine S-methyltransferase, partial [Steroidobacteraceae bacterium]